jgi:hypothetical protein
MKYQIMKFVIAFAFSLAVAGIVPAQVASGGSYTLNKGVVANGGGLSAGGNYTVQGTAGEPAVGVGGGGSYTARNGFWTRFFAPTAAAVSVGGRVINQGGHGIPQVFVLLSGGNLTTPLIRRTNSFGYFSFNEVEVGQIYVLSVRSKAYGFGQNAQVISVTEDLTGIVFQASWNN